MRNFNFFYFISILLFFGCTDEEAPKINAPTVGQILAEDISDNGNGSDLEISFNAVDDESLVSEYRVFVVNNTSLSQFDLMIAESLDDDLYVQSLPNGDSKKIILDETSKDTDGNLIIEDVEYYAFVLTIADGVNATGDNSLSNPSNSIILETEIVDAPRVQKVNAFDVGNNGDGTDLEISFSKLNDESLISEYRVLVVNSQNQPDFDLEMAESVESPSYTKIEPINEDIKFTLDGSSTDTDGNLITEEVEYKVFVLTVVDGVNALGSNSLSGPSIAITLKQLLFEVYVSDAGGFGSGNPPWQILKFDGNGQNPKVFIDENIAWPQDIIFFEDKNEVLISNLSSGRITKHNASTGEFIEDFASSIDGPTRMKIGPDNLLYVLQWEGEGIVLRYSLEGDFIDEFTTTGVFRSIGIDWDNEGNLYVSSFADKLIRKFDENGQDLGVFINTNLEGPTNIWFDSNGDLLVSDYNGGAIKKFNSTGEFISNFISDVSNTEGIAYLPDGNFLIGNGGDNSVKMFNNNGEYIEDFIPTGSGNLVNPNAIVIRDIE